MVLATTSRNGHAAPAGFSVLRVAIVLCGILLLPARGTAQGWWWGSRINPGFDRKTVIQVTGTVAEIKFVDEGGPSKLRLNTSDESFDVVLAPGSLVIRRGWMQCLPD
ncbi:MAG: hypothetical protein HY695_19835 [Deltaproteobacteria bacterium]|nr:hypothetical protein [Deltaproteobacteria bacterium]